VTILDLVEHVAQVLPERDGVGFADHQASSIMIDMVDKVIILGVSRPRKRANLRVLTTQPLTWTTASG
jgi:hypothetical protein